MGYTCLVSCLLRLRSLLDHWSCQPARWFRLPAVFFRSLLGCRLLSPISGSVVGACLGSFGLRLGAWPETAKRSRIQAPRWPGAEIGGILQFDAAAMVFQHAADDREPKAGALLARVVT